MADIEQEDFLDELTAVVRWERSSLVRCAAREGLEAQDALECVQDALCTFLRMRQEGEVRVPREAWGAFLAGMVRNGARNWRRRHALARPHVTDVETASEAAAPDELLMRAEAHVRLQRCVAQLCDAQRAVVLLRLLDEQPGEDVALSLGISRSYVDVLTHRAKASLRACMLRCDAT